MSGVVRDTRGTPQMGVMVELLGAGTSTTALTDLQGYYQIRDVVPGVYQLRATAALYLPSLRRQVRLTSSTRPIVNLMMSGLFEESTWASANHPGLDNPEDWKWTLRSPANRPMLRLTADSSGATVADVDQQISHDESQGSLSLGASHGGFGSPGYQGTLTVLRRSVNRARTIGFRSSIARAETGVASGPMSLSTMLESDAGGLGKHRVGVSARTFPQVRDASGNALRELAGTSAEQMSIGDLAVLEAGSQTQLLTSGATVLATHPFVHLTSRPIAGWTASYGFSTQPGLGRYEDAATSAEIVPTVIRSGAKLETDAGWHQEIAAGRSLGKTKIRIAYGRDASRRTALTGRLTRPRNATATSLAESGGSPAPVVFDSSDGTFRLLAQGFGSNGGSVAIDVPLSDDFSISGGYLTHRALELVPDPAASGLGSFRAARMQSVAVTFTGRVSKSGTRVSASYRWQPARAISTVAPYETAGSSPYLSVHIRQPLNATRSLSPLEFTLDGDNVLQEGSQGYALGRQEAFLTSALQELRAGLSVTF